MERMSADDQVMLWPDALWPQEIGAIAILDREVRVEDLRAVLAARLHLVPRFRQLLHIPGPGRGGPLWIDAPHFNLDQHLRVVPLVAPADEAALLRAVERMRAQRLSRSRPLWQIAILPGLADGRAGLFVKMHHAVADGLAGIATIATFLDADADVPPVAAPSWRPRPAPTAPELVRDNLRRRATTLGRGLSRLAHPVVLTHQAGAAWSAVREMFAVDPVPATSLNRALGPARSLALVRVRLDDVQLVARTHRATVNDVLLAVIAGGLRELLAGRGEAVEEVRVDVPVTLRSASTRAQARGNLIGQMIVPLPVGEPDAVRRLTLIAAETAVLKASEHPSMGVVLRSRVARRALLKVLARDPVNVTTADLVGPPQPVYLAGARLLEVFPVLPLMGTLSLGVGALSYAGQFAITVVADRDAHPDLDVFAAGLRRELEALGIAEAGLDDRPAEPSHDDYPVGHVALRRTG
jgi:diacylglycerol O-acyltransferase